MSFIVRVCQVSQVEESFSSSVREEASSSMMQTQTEPTDTCSDGRIHFASSTLFECYIFPSLRLRSNRILKSKLKGKCEQIRLLSLCMSKKSINLPTKRSILHLVKSSLWPIISQWIQLCDKTFSSNDKHLSLASTRRL